jgi:DNA polymerase-3 subunit beta
MHGICQVRELHRALELVERTAPARSLLPILRHVLLSVRDGRVCLSATNLDMEISIWIPAQVLQEGSVTVPARLFSAFVASLPPTSCDLSLAEGSFSLALSAGSSRARIQGMDPAQFPPVRSEGEVGEDLLLLFEASQLKELIRQVAFAASTDETRPTLTGVYVENTGETLTVAAADGFRLAVRTLPYESDETMCGSLLIPARTLVELARLLPTEGSVEMYILSGQSQVLFRTECMTLVSRVLEGTFPDFRQYLSKPCATRVVVETRELAEAVKTALPFARDGENILSIEARGTGSEDLVEGTMTLSANVEELGGASSAISVAMAGPDQKLRFNVKYLADALAVLTTPQLTLELTSEQRPGIIKPVGDTTTAYVIMPMSMRR